MLRCNKRARRGEFRENATAHDPPEQRPPDQRPTEPARVYPSPDAPNHWVVEAPSRRTALPAAPMLFSGPNAERLALQYAYEEFGGARFFPY
jgi:hypothetical protein